MAIPIINDWEKYFQNPHEGLGSSYERIVLNALLRKVVDKYEVKTILESPSFGFTGVSGINLMALTDFEAAITLEDNNERRLALIKELWDSQQRPLKPVFNPDFRQLDYPDNSFDMSFSFSALWFVPDLRVFLSELARVTNKVIFLSVPNRDGLGYKMQLKDYNSQKYPDIKLGNIDQPSIISILSGLGWKMDASGYFDCPPWPDIGMTKEDLLNKTFPRCPLRKCLLKPKKANEQIVSILDFYSGEDMDFDDRMLRFQWLEQHAPKQFKRIWAHHYYMVFEPKS